MRRHYTISDNGALADGCEDDQVDEVHHAEDEQDQADFGAEDFDAVLEVGWAVAVAEGEGDVADVDQVEADDQQVVDRFSDGSVSAKGFDEEDRAALEKRSRDPDGQEYADAKISQVSPNHDVHFHTSSCYVSYFCTYRNTIPKQNSLSANQFPDPVSHADEFHDRGHGHGTGLLVPAGHQFEKLQHRRQAFALVFVARPGFGVGDALAQKL